jgi:hemolysin activation/secretion protein
LNAGLQLFNPLGIGDVLGASALNSGALLNYGRLSYEIPLDVRGGYLGAAASSLQYSLGSTAASLQAQGNAKSGSVWLRKYLVHHQGRSVGLRLQYEASKLRDDVDSTGNHNSRQLELWSLELQAQEETNWLAGSYSSVNMGVRSGRLAFDDAVAQSSDALTAKTQGNFGVVSLSLEHLQRLNSLTSVMLAFNGQWAQSNLDASQKMSLGGAHSVRAYDSGVLSGDSGQFASLELQQTIAPAWNGNSRWQVVLFMDAGQVQISQTPWSKNDNQAFISGAGVGLKWQGPSDWHASLYSARAMAPASVQLDGTDSSHINAWIEIGKRF